MKMKITYNQIKSLAGKTAPLYCQYAGQAMPQDANLELDLESGILTADYDSAIGNSVPVSVYEGKTLRLQIPNNLTGRGVNELVEWYIEEIERLLNNPDDMELQHDLEYRLANIQSGDFECAEIVQAEDWYGQDLPELVRVAEEVKRLSDSEIEALAAEMDSDSKANWDNLVILGTAEYLKELKGE